MPIQNVDELVRYELGIVRDGELAGLRLLDLILHRASREDLIALVRDLQQELGRHQDRLDSYIRAGIGAPTASYAEPASAMYGRFEQFIGLRPAPDLVNQFAADTVVRFLHLGIVAHRTLRDWAILMGDLGLVRCVHGNLLEKEASAARFEAFSHQLGTHYLMPADQRKQEAVPG